MYCAPQTLALIGKWTHSLLGRYTCTWVDGQQDLYKGRCKHSLKGLVRRPWSKHNQKLVEGYWLTEQSIWLTQETQGTRLSHRWHSLHLEDTWHHCFISTMILYLDHYRGDHLQCHPMTGFMIWFPTFYLSQICIYSFVYFILVTFIMYFDHSLITQGSSYKSLY